MVFQREKYVKQLEERKHNGMIKVINSRNDEYGIQSINLFDFLLNGVY